MRGRCHIPFFHARPLEKDFLSDVKVLHHFCGRKVDLTRNRLTLQDIGRDSSLFLVVEHLSLPIGLVPSLVALGGWPYVRTEAGLMAKAEQSCTPIVEFLPCAAPAPFQTHTWSSQADQRGSTTTSRTSITATPTKKPTCSQGSTRTPSQPTTLAPQCEHPASS